MGFLFGDAGGAHYAAADILKRWSVSFGSPTISSTGNPYGGPAISLTQGAYVGKTLTSNYTTLIAGCRINIPSGANAPGGNEVLGLYDAATGLQVSLQLGTGGTLRVLRGSTVLGTSSAGLIVVGQAYHLQLKVLIDGSVGTYAVRLNGAAPTGLADATGQNTKNQTVSTANQVRFSGPTSGQNTVISDMYICDTSGSVNNDFMGDVRGYVLNPTGAGNYTQWTPLSGANYTNVDETSFNGDTDYNYDGTVGHIDSYAMADLASGYAVKAVQLVGALRKDDAGSRSAALFLRQTGNSTDVVGTTQSLLDTYLFYTQPYDTDPSDSSAWTAAKVNSLEVGAKVIS